MIEQRTITADMEAMCTQGRTLRGFACLYSVQSRDLGGFTETIDRGAFDDVLASEPDVYLTFNHSPDKVLARTSSGTLRLHDEERGLAFEADLGDGPTAQDVRDMVRRGDLSGCSFRFQVAPDGERWQGERRTLTRIAHLIDLSLATTPAYDGPGVELRTHTSKEPEVTETTSPTPDTTESATATPTTDPSATATGGATTSLTVEQRTARPEGATVEQRVIEAMRSVPKGEVRSLTTADNSAGPVTPPELSTMLWDLLRDQAVVLQTGVPIITTDRTNVKWPRLVSDMTADFFDELDEIDESDPGFDDFDVTPKAVKALVRGSSEAFEDSDPDLLQIVQQNMVAVMALRLDKELIVGGSTKGFDGMLNVTGTTSIDANGTLDNYDPFLRAIGILSGNHVPGPYVTITHPWVVTALDLLKRQDANNEQLPRPASVPQFHTTTQVGHDNTEDTSTAIVFAPAQVPVVRRRDVTVEIDRSQEFTSDAVLVRGKLRACSFFPYPQAIVKIENLPAPDPSE